MVILGYLIVAACLASCAWWNRPITGGGRLTLLLMVINAIGWLVMLPQDYTYKHGLSIGTLVAMLFFLVNLPLLPAAITSLVVGFREGERRPFVAIAATYLGLNTLVFIGLPLCALILACFGVIR
jgi:hypothetical protein